MSRRILERAFFFSAAWYLLNYASTGEEGQTPGAGLGTRGSRVRTASKQGLISFLGQHECRADFKFFVRLYSNTLSFWISGQACDFPRSNALTRQSYKKARVCWWLHIVAHSDKKCQLLTGCFCNHFCTKIQCRKKYKTNSRVCGERPLSGDVLLSYSGLPAEPNFLSSMSSFTLGISNCLSYLPWQSGFSH